MERICRKSHMQRAARRQATIFTVQRQPDFWRGLKGERQGKHSGVSYLSNPGIPDMFCVQQIGRCICHRYSFERQNTNTIVIKANKSVPHPFLILPGLSPYIYLLHTNRQGARKSRDSEIVREGVSPKGSPTKKARTSWKFIGFIYRFTISVNRSCFGGTPQEKTTPSRPACKRSMAPGQQLTKGWYKHFLFSMNRSCDQWFRGAQLFGCPVPISIPTPRPALTKKSTYGAVHKVWNLE